jgi:Tfp pilus assembly protein PilX
MKNLLKKSGSVLIVVVFAIALLTAFVAGMLQINAEQFQLMRNEVYAAQSMAIAEAGLADAFSQLRTDSSWTSGFNNKSFGDGSYTVTVTGLLPNLVIESTGTSPQSFIARANAEITVGTTSPYIIRIDKLRINE